MVHVPTAFDAMIATHDLVEQALNAPHREHPTTGVVSASVARQMLYLLGDNEHWSTRPNSKEMATWATIRSASPEGFEVLARFYPEQCEAWRHALKSWGLDWLRGIVEKAWTAAGERLDAIAAEVQS